MINNYYHEECTDLLDIKQKLINDGLKKNYKHCSANYNKSSVPIIALFKTKSISSNKCEIINRTLDFFQRKGYNGICVSQSFNTDLNKSIVNIYDYCDVNVSRLSDRITFFENYFNIDLVILEIEQQSTLEEIDMEKIDIAIYNTKCIVENLNENNSDGIFFIEHITQINFILEKILIMLI